MKTFIIALLLIAFVTYCYGDQVDIRPRYQDTNPNDGYMDAGSRFNPFVIVDNYGNEIGSINARYPEHDNRGTQYNPYEVEWDD